MPSNESGAQEIRRARGTVELTDDEKLDVILLKSHRVRPTESDILRDFTIAQITERANTIRAAVEAASRAPQLALSETD